ncbi:tripartite tricarboxylate transporter TctB family protein [Elioraea rosea]|uniref:tripartite tricarboxylate transporter TctB family protein n=1 Tax=Elioraea rosea TaxID=2492390 RepID=UPI001182F4EC|nr:tripartite tricarboxylate transporter TctB family protein [Elioraea rosea]
MRVNEAVIGVLLIVLAVAVFLATASFPRIPGQPYGPDLFPRLVGALLGLAGVMMIIRGVAMTPRRPLVEFPEWARSHRAAGAIVLALASVIAYILVSDTVGFVISAAVMLLVLMLYLRVRPHVAVIASVATTLMVEYGFGSLMRIPLPRGLLVVFA